MGYPMTYQRVIHRNALDHDALNIEWHASAGADVDEASHPRLHYAYDGWREAAARFNNRARLLFDDLRRLERDALDEDALCRGIASRTGVEPDVVAAVLKDFFAQ